MTQNIFFRPGFILAFLAVIGGVLLLMFPPEVLSPQEVKAASLQAELCPYEITLLLAAKARLIITDYLYGTDAEGNATYLPIYSLGQAPAHARV